MKKMFALIALAAATATAAPVIRSAAEPDYPPLSIVNEQGVASGFVVELLRAALAAMGREVEFETAPWNELLQRFASGEFDVLPLVGRTPEREELFDFSIPYLTLHGALFIREDQPDIRRLADLPDRTVAVMRGDNAEEYVRRAKLTDRIVTTATFEEAFRMLSEGRVDAVIAQKLMGVTLLKKNGITNIEVTGAPNEEFKQDFCFGVKKGDRALLALLNEGLMLVMNDGTHRRLLQQWLARALRGTERSRVLHYGAGALYPPYNMPDEQGRPSGFSVDMIRAVTAAVGTDVQVEMAHWSEISARFATGDLDVVSMLYDPRRAEIYDFSLPYASVCHALFGRKGGPAWSGPASLVGNRVAVQRGNILHEWAQQQGLNDELVLTKDLEHSLELLQSGKVDFALGPHIQGMAWIHQNPRSGILPLDEHLLLTDYCFAVHKDRKELLNLLNEGLREVQASGQFRQLEKKWLDQHLNAYQWRQFRKVLLTLIGALLLVAGLALSIIYGLKRQVQRHTAEMEAANRELKESRTATLNMMEDALQAKQRMEITQYALDHAADEVFWIRPDGSYAYVNETASKALGWSREELLEMGLKDVDPEFPFEQWPQHWAELKEKKTLVFESIHRTRDGSEFPVEIHACYLSFGGEEYNCAFAHNIANRKVADDKIRLHLEELQRWQNATSGREGRVMELKKEVNRLLEDLGQPPKYGSVQHD